MTTYTATDLRNDYNEAMKAHEANAHFATAYESLKACARSAGLSVFADLGAEESKALATAYNAWQSPYAGGGWGDHARNRPLETCSQFCEMCH
jgi:hypothetical protein